jgi:phosphatidylglycerol:prolipoprotein diacylglycerol transferase
VFPGLGLGEALTALGYCVGSAVFALAARRRGVATEGMGWVALAGLMGGVLGAKLAEWVFAGVPAGALGWDPRAGGRTLLGGVAGGWLAVEAAKAALGIRRSTGDLFAVALPAGEAVGRLGCFVNGCCHGTPALLPWSVFQHDAWRHPAQLYAAAGAAAILAAVLTLRPRLPREGDLFRAFCVLFGAARFAVEFSRERTILAGGLSAAQWAALALAAWGGASLARRGAPAAVGANDHSPQPPQPPVA